MLAIIPPHQYKRDPEPTWMLPGDIQFHDYCRDHLRPLLGRTFGLKTNATTVTLLNRAQDCLMYLADLNELRGQQHTLDEDWWTNQCLPVNRSCWKYSLDIESALP